MKFFQLLLAAATSSALQISAMAAETDAGTQPEGTAEKAADDNWESEKRQAALRVQLFLDSKGFGPGKIDGRWGGFTEKAAIRWNEAKKDQPIAILEDGSLDTAKAADLPYAGDLLTTYKITAEDAELLGDLPESPAEKVKLDHLPYTDLMELVSEKFHADPDLIIEINGLESGQDLTVGTEVKVPAVTERFEIQEPMDLAEKANEEKNEVTVEEEKEAAEKVEKPELSMTVLRDARIVEVRRDGELIHSFPISPGASDNQSPAGDWKVSAVTWMPEFRWDKSMLEDGKRSDDAHLLPPGPNNPVGIVWIGLSADGIGLHGTPFPDAIGRNRSHGCIRLANWDALKLGKIATSGTPVTIR